MQRSIFKRYLGITMGIILLTMVLNIINNPQGTKRSMIGLAIVVVVLGYFIVKRVVKKRKAAQAGQQNPKA